jgi:hypothetical protein
VFGVPSKETGMLVEEVVRKTVVMRSKTAFQTSTSEACLTTRRDSARWC